MIDAFVTTWQGWPEWLRGSLISLGQILTLTVIVILCVAYLTLAERKVIGYMQCAHRAESRGPKGLLQPFADVLKLLIKEVVIPTRSNRFLFLLAPLLALVPAFAAWAVISLWPGFSIANVDAGAAVRARAQLGFGVYGDHPRGLGDQLEVRLPRRDALGRADRRLRDRDGLRAGRRA